MVDFLGFINIHPQDISPVHNIIYSQIYPIVTETYIPPLVQSDHIKASSTI